jgi:hypothetical protein
MGTKGNSKQTNYNIYWNLVLVFLVFLEVGCLTLGFLSAPAFAMGSKPQPKEEPKYKLEVIKMEFVPSYQMTLESKAAVKPLKTKQKVK